MIVIVSVSKRRCIVLDVERRESSYQAADGHPGKGFAVASARQLTEKPMSWFEARKVAGDHCAKLGRLITPEQWEQFNKGGRGR